METLQLKPGMLIEFEYPAANYCGIRPRWERRRLRVDRVRILDREPLDPVTTEIEPRLARGSTLVTGLDLDKWQERSFYLESMRELIKCVACDSLPHDVLLLDEDGSSPELVYRANSGQEAIKWAEQWLSEPLGFIVGVRRAS